jgi:hypothetical protein
VTFVSAERTFSGGMRGGTPRNVEEIASFVLFAVPVLFPLTA